MCEYCFFNCFFLNLFNLAHFFFLSFFLFSPTYCSTVIQLHPEELPLTASTLASKSSPGLSRMDTMGSLSILDPAAQPRSSSPTHSSGSSDTDRSLPTSTGSYSTGSIPSLPIAKLEERWTSPTSSLSNIYVPQTTIVPQPSTARKGWNFGLFGASGYQADHSD